MEDLTKNIIFTTNAINGQPATIQYQTADGTILKQPKIEGQKADQQPTFYYTTNVSEQTNKLNVTLNVITLSRSLCRETRRR